MKKIVCIVIAMMVSASVYAANAKVEGWYKVKIVNVGLSGTSSITARFVDDPEFAAWNNLTESQACAISIEPIGKVVLAILLSAQTMDSSLNVYLVPTESNFWILKNVQIEP